MIIYAVNTCAEPSGRAI